MKTESGDCDGKIHSPDSQNNTCQGGAVYAHTPKKAQRMRDDKFLNQTLQTQDSSCCGRSTSHFQVDANHRFAKHLLKRCVNAGKTIRNSNKLKSTAKAQLKFKKSLRNSLTRRKLRHIGAICNVTSRPVAFCCVLLHLLYRGRRTTIVSIQEQKR